MKNIKKISVFILAVIFSLSSTLTGCEAVKNTNKTQRGAGIGVVLGGVLGAVIGNNVGGGGNGAIGAVLGGVTVVHPYVFGEYGRGNCATTAARAV